MIGPKAFARTVGAEESVPSTRFALPPISILTTAAPLSLILLAVVASPFLGLANPSHIDLSNTLLPPAWDPSGSRLHPLGTDELGRDMLARLVYGGRLTFAIATAAVLLGAIPGVTVGLCAGYFRGPVDLVISRLIDAQLALPVLLIAIAIISSWGHSLHVLVGLLALVGWAQYARVVRSEALSLRERPYMLALRAVGFSSTRIVLRHLLPNLAGIVLALVTLQVGSIILTESALSFLGLGVVPPDISWGQMLSSGQDQLTEAWWIAAFPGIAILLVVLLVNLLGDALLAQYDPRRQLR